MIVALWNSPSTNTAFHSPVRIGLRGTWPNVVPAFNVDGRDVPARDAVARLKLLPVLDWVIDKGVPPDWSAANVAKINSIVRTVYKSLGGWWGLSKAFRATIRHVTDFEDYTQAIDRTSARLSETTGMPFAGTFAHVMGQALRSAGFVGPAANYAMAHGPDCPPLGGPPFNRATPFHCPAAMDGRTTFLSGYTSPVDDPDPEGDGPDGCLKSAELIDAMERSGYRWYENPQMWLALSADYQPSMESVIHAAVENGVDLLLLWADEKRRREDAHFGPANDWKIAKYLSNAGWVP